MKILDDQNYFDSFFKEKTELDDEILHHLKNTNSVTRDNPFFLFLRRYNSFTPAVPLRTGIKIKGKASQVKQFGEDEYVRDIKDEDAYHRHFTDVKGGGCYLSWDGKGVVIDPGFDFIENMYSEGLAIGDVDVIAITHAHNDHYMDLVPLLTLAYIYNKLSNAYMAIVAGEYEEALGHITKLIEIYPYSFAVNAYLYCKSKLGRLRQTEEESSRVQESIAKFERDLVNISEKVHKIYIPKKILLYFSESSQASLNELIKTIDPNGQWIECMGGAAIPEELSNFVIIKEDTDTRHNDFKRITGKGIKFVLGDFKIGLTGDTGWYDNNDIIKYKTTPYPKQIDEYFSDCNILIPHIGSILESEYDWFNLRKDHEKINEFNNSRYETHLGVLGLLRLITDIKSEANNLTLVAITEFGEEMKYMRHQLALELDNYSAISSTTKYLAADIGLKIKLPWSGNPLQIRVESKNPNTGEIDYSYEDVMNVTEKICPLTGNIIYVKK